MCCSAGFCLPALPLPVLPLPCRTLCMCSNCPAPALPYPLHVQQWSCLCPAVPFACAATVLPLPSKLPTPYLTHSPYLRLEVEKMCCSTVSLQTRR